jgi:hypothetical protein
MFKKVLWDALSMYNKSKGSVSLYYETYILSRLPRRIQTLI